jgi:aminoglycoside 6'-N-acetyltransferase
VDRLREHDVTLRRGHIVLRPMTEEDWDILLKWNTDPEVLHFAEGARVAEYSLEAVQDIYRGVSQNAFCFILELRGEPVGECWLQRMNLPRILERYPGRDCRRIDLMIGEKAFWGKGIGTEAIRLLARFGFERERADMIFGCDVGDHNPRSLRAFQKASFEVCASIPQSPGAKARVAFDLLLSREKYWADVRPSAPAGR